MRNNPEELGSRKTVSHFSRAETHGSVDGITLEVMMNSKSTDGIAVYGHIPLRDLNLQRFVRFCTRVA